MDRSTHKSIKAGNMDVGRHKVEVCWFKTQKVMFYYLGTLPDFGRTTDSRFLT